MKRKLTYAILATTVGVGIAAYVSMDIVCIFPQIFGTRFCFDPSSPPTPCPKSIEPYQWPGAIGDETPK